ncbi:MAG: MFS transporter [Clostridia bacterium]|nr:MFS transporter [Clostridia bacterium]
MKFKLSQKAKEAFMLGGLCSVSYFAVYIARNVLGAVTPKILESGAFTEIEIGSMSSVYFAAYAIGQLINGFMGDRIKAKYMIAGGLILAGITNFIFPYLTVSATAATAVYGLTGFSLAMIYAPMTKIVSENTEQIYAVRCSFGYTFASFFATPAAGLFATFLAWQTVFTVSSSVLGIMGALSFAFFTLFERRGIVKYGQYEKNAKESGSIKALFEHAIVRFSIISIITGIIRTSVIFWLATYINQYLGFLAEQSAGIYTGATFIISMMSIIAIVIYEAFGRRRDFTIVIMFIVSAISFLLTYLVSSPILNIIFIVLAIMASNGAAAILWSVYCPSLRDTGRVSTATGFLDFVSYMAAAVANIVFANAATSIGWGNLILVWFGIVLVGLFASIPYKDIAKRKHEYFDK